jgi:hypothetical protein
MLWRLAENADAAERADFLARRPELENELLSREQMVGKLRSARPVAPIPTKFFPSAAVRPRPMWLAPLAAGLLVGLAFASYQIVRSNQAEPKAAPAKRTVVPQSPIPKLGDDSRLEVRKVDPTVSPGTSERPTEYSASDLVVIDVKSATLFATLEAIRGKGIKVQAMPGLEDKPIVLEPNHDDGKLELPALQMLTAVQKAADFELVDAGPDGYLALPKDKTSRVGSESGTVRNDGN